MGGTVGDVVEAVDEDSKVAVEEAERDCEGDEDGVVGSPV